MTIIFQTNKKMEEQKQSKPKKNGIDEEEKDTLDSECSTNYA